MYSHLCLLTIYRDIMEIKKKNNNKFVHEHTSTAKQTKTACSLGFC